MLQFSIILPTYNRAHRIEKAIQSVLHQTHQNWELIIIDDASTDHTFKIVSRFSDERIRYLRNEQNQERCISRNIGIEESKGEYICFLDSDDYHLPNHLSMLHDFIVRNNFPQAFIFTNAWDETETGIRTERNCPNLNDFDYYTYLLRYTVNPQRWCVHRRIFEEIKFDPDVTICEDMDTSLRIVEKGFPIFQIQERTTVYVAADDSFTHGDSKKWEKELNYLKKIVSKIELKPHLPRKEINRLFSMCYFHIAQIAFQRGERSLAFKNIIANIIKYHKGYKPGLTKITLVLFLYNFPLIGKFIQIVFQKKKKVTVSLPKNIQEEHVLLMEKYSSYSIREERLIHKRNVLVTPEGLIGKFGVLNQYCGFNLRGFKDNNFYGSYSRLFLEQSIVSFKGKSLKRFPIVTKSLVIHSKWFNYGFWLNSSLVRLLLAEKQGVLNDVELIYPKSWKTLPFVNESLSLFSNLKIREVPDDQIYACKELYFHEVRKYTGSLNPDHVKMLRDEIPKKLGVTLVEPFRKVYVTRKKRGVRIPENENEIITLLTSKGFEIIDFDDLTFSEQVTLMTQTKYLISIHGAGMANINFMQKGTFVLELINESYAKVEYTFPFWKLGTLNELNYFVLFCPTVDNTKINLINSKSSKIDEANFLVNQNITIDIQMLDSLVI